MTPRSAELRPLIDAPHTPCFASLTNGDGGYPDSIRGIWATCDAVAALRGRAPAREEVAEVLEEITPDRNWYGNMNVTTCYNAWCRHNGITLEERRELSK